MPTRKTPLPATARCLICGDALALPVFDCPACATPHHTACWQWTGGCAVYGCARRPRPVREHEREEELARVASAAVAAVAARAARPAPRAPAASAAPADFGPAARLAAVIGARALIGLGQNKAAMAWLLAALLGSPAAPPAPSAPPAPIQRAAASARVPFRPSIPVMTQASLAERLVRDDHLWGGAGDVPSPSLRSMMVARRGLELRSGVRQLAQRDLPDWVRARVRALSAVVEGVDPSPMLLALRRP